MSEDVNHSVVGGGRGVVQARSCGGGGDARHCSVIIVARVAADEYSFVMVLQSLNRVLRGFLAIRTVANAIFEYE